MSDVSILRFVRLLGYEGFSDLKEDLNEKILKELGNSSLTERMKLKECNFLIIPDIKIQNNLVQLSTKYQIKNIREDIY